MKKIITLVTLISISINSFSQTKSEINNSLKKIEDAKSGNLVDAFSGFYQFAFKSINVNQKSLELNSNLFSLVNNYDENIVQTKSRSSIVFLRNFQVNLKLNLNDRLNFNGYSGGFTYAILNDRDKNFINLTGLPIEKHLDELNKLIHTSIIKVISDDNGKNPNLADDLSIIATNIVNGKKVDKSLSATYTLLKTEIDSQINNSNYFQKLSDSKGNKITTVDSIVSFIKDLKDKSLKVIENKPFLSIASDGITDKNGKLNQYSIGTVFLAGSHFGEFDIRAKYNYADTLNPGTPRDNFNGKFGYNFKILRGNDNKSYFEIKAYGEYNKILKNVLPNEKQETILANADFRIKLTDNVWLPITVKYDKTNNNFLGFLNVTYNFEGSKK